MTFDDFATAVAGIAGPRGSVATQDVRRYTTGNTERRWTAWVATREEGPGVLADGSSPEGAIEKLRGLLEGDPSVAPAASSEADP